MSRNLGKRQREALKMLQEAGGTALGGWIRRTYWTTNRAEQVECMRWTLGPYFGAGMKVWTLSNGIEVDIQMINSLAKRGLVAVDADNTVSLEKLP